MRESVAARLEMPPRLSQNARRRTPPSSRGQPSRAHRVPVHGPITSPQVVVEVALSPAQFRTTTAAATDVGRRRTGNEDSYSIWLAETDGQPHAADTLIVVCDGMGGSNAGEV